MVDETGGKRIKIFTLRLSADEYELIRQAAHHLGLTISAFLRSQALQKSRDVLKEE